MHNNLTIENLMKTEWFTQFNEEQQEEIKIGNEKGLDVSLYAKKDFDENEMLLIRIALEDNLDVFLLTTKEFNIKQKLEILAGLRKGLNVYKYANPKLTDEEMNKIRKELMEENERKQNI